MKAVVLGSSVLAVLFLAACNGGAPSPGGPSSPGAPPPVTPASPGGPGTATAAPAAPDDQIAYLESAGAYPPGFQPKFRVSPGPGVDGVIRGASPLEVEFDLCGSTAEAGKSPRFLFDWDFDHVADAVGGRDACHQVHRFRVPSGNGGRDQNLRANVCVANGDTRGDAGTYVSCRSYALAIPTPSQFPPGCGLFFGGDFLECLQGRVLREDELNDGSFESAWFISTDEVVGDGGECPPDTEYDGVEVGEYREIDLAFYAFLRNHGFEDTNDFCELD